MFANMSRFHHLSGFSIAAALLLCVSPAPSAQGDETPETVEAVPTETGDETPTAAPPTDEHRPPGVEGPLFVVSPDEVEPGDAQQVREIYRRSDTTFANVLWWWVVLLAVLAGLGYGAYVLWGRRQPRPPSGR